MGRQIFYFGRKEINLSMGDWNGKRQPELTLKLPKVPMGQVKEVELVFDRKWYVCLSYDDGIQRKKKNKV